MIRRRTTISAMAVAAVVGSIAWVGTGLAQDRPPAPLAAPGGPAGALDGETLIRGLLATPGCLGADAGQWRSGKNTIIAWFEDKAAVVRWYESRTHQNVIDVFGGSDRVPLEHVKDDQKPIMVLATITMAAHPSPEMPLPVSQIAIELFVPLPGGAHVGGRLAPPTFKVPHMRDYTPAAEPATGDGA